jgi:hypothetical protein
MEKGFRILSIIMFITMITLPATGQENQALNLYEPKALVRRLSYDNFKKIRMMTAAIMNFGGGEQEFNRLIDKYAEASALYFSKEYEKSAEVFADNQKEINKTAMSLANRYKQDTIKLQKQIITLDVKRKIKASLEGKKYNPTLEKLVREASEAVAAANDLYIRSRPVHAIFYYRRAKEKIFLYYEIVKDTAFAEEQQTEKVSKKKIPEKDKKSQKYKKLLDSYERDQIDNQNKVYIAQEKGAKEKIN